MTRKTDVGVPDAVDLIAHYLPLEDSGKRGFRGYCPFCNKIEATLYVRRDLQEWHCFGCGAGGDIYDFVARFEGLVRADAIASVARRYATQGQQPAQVANEARRSSVPVPDAAAMVVELAQQQPGITSPEAAGEPERAGRYEAVFAQMRKIAGYHGAAILDASSAVLASDQESPSLQHWAELGTIISELFARAATLLPAEDEDTHAVSNLSLAAREGAILALKIDGSSQARMLLTHTDDSATVVSARLRLVAAGKLVDGR
jgi:hypothetical protein